MLRPLTFWELPGPAGFIERVCADLNEGAIVVLAMPNASSAPDLYRRLGQTQLRRLRHYDLREFDPAADLSAELALALGLELAHATPKALADHEAMHELLLFVEARRATAAQLHALRSFTAEYVAAQVPRHPSQRCPFIVVCRGEDLPRAVPPEGTVLVRPRWWWGVVSHLDTTLKVHSDERARLRDPAEVEAVVSLAAYDIECADHLLDNWDGEVGGLAELMQDWARERAIKSCDVPPVLCGEDRPANNLLPLWSSGVVERWDAAVPVSVHRANSGVYDAKALEQEVWRGQQRALLGAVDLHRRFYAEWLVARRVTLGKKWRGREDLLHLEVRELALATGTMRVADVPDRAARLEQIEVLRSARNSLAHLKPLGPAELRRLRTTMTGLVADRPDRLNLL